jgi:hypothetical protein
MHLPKFV